MKRIICQIMPFYAVQIGRKPGIYTSWDECKLQVDKFFGARYKKFPSEVEAEDFINGGACGKSTDKISAKLPPQTKSTVNKTTQLSLKSSMSGIKKSLNEAKTFVTQADDTNLLSLKSSLDKIKKSLKEAKTFVTQAEDTIASAGLEPSNPESCQSKTDTNSRKRQRTDSTEEESHKNQKSSPVVVYTDGSCTNNGFEGARAGIGVYWGPNNERNLSERVSGRQTNNRAEIFAATRAIQQAKQSSISDIVIKTDSQFLIQCITKWIDKWRTNGWKTSSGDVQNKIELIELDNELKSGINVQWVHVRGHKGHAGNEAADKLANEGAAKASVDS